MSSNIRGYAEVKVDGKSVPLRLTLGALAQTQSDIGALTLADLGLRIAGADMVALTVLLRHCLNAAGGDFDEAHMLQFAPDEPAMVLQTLNGMLESSGLWVVTPTDETERDEAGAPAGKSEPKSPKGFGKT